MRVAAGNLFTIDAGTGGDALFIHGPYLAKQDLDPQELLNEFAEWVRTNGEAGITRMSSKEVLQQPLAEGFPGDRDRDASAFVGWLESTDKAVLLACDGFTVSSTSVNGQPRKLSIGDAEVELPQPFPGPLGLFGR